MADEKVINPNLEPLEDSVNLAEKFGHIEKNGIGSGENKKEENIFSMEKESPKEVVGAEKDASYNDILSKIAQKSGNSDDDNDVKTDAQAVSQKIDAESQIQHLVDLATTKGVVHAVKVARHMDDNYVLDMLHDKMISEEFRKILVEKNFISSE